MNKKSLLLILAAILMMIATLIVVHHWPQKKDHISNDRVHTQLTEDTNWIYMVALPP